MRLSYLLKRFLLAIYTLLIVSIVVFGITQILPADAAVTLLGENATPAALEAVRHQLGLNDPAWLQYWRWLTGILQGDFGVSMRNGLPVAHTLLLALSRSLLLAACALSIVLIIAIPLGIWAAVHRGSLADLLVGITSYVGISFPEFVIATVLILLFSDHWHLLPATGYIPLGQDLLGGLKLLILPSVTLSLILVAHISRMVRSEMVDVLQTDYIRAARLRGLSHHHVLWHHALRNGLLPTITIVALDVGYLLGGIVVVEEIFSIPGIGREIIVAIQARDLPTIQMSILILAAVYCLANLLADILYAWLDPRIQYA